MRRWFCHWAARGSSEGTRRVQLPSVLQLGTPLPDCQR